MEVKYGKKSGKTLEELAALYDAEMKEREEERKRIQYERMELDGYFHSAKEMIDYVLGGERIVSEDGEWMQLKDEKIIHYKMFYNDIDIPLGMGYASMSIEEFKTWVYRCEDYQKEDGSPFVNEYFHKNLEDEI